MRVRKLVAVVFAIGLGFFAGYMARPFFSDFAVARSAESETLVFDSDVTSYSYSEKGIIGIRKIDDRNYAINAVNPGMCVVSFSMMENQDAPVHARRGRFIVSVSPSKKLTIQETKFVAGGML